MWWPHNNCLFSAPSTRTRKYIMYPPPTMGHIIASTYLYNKIYLLSGKLMYNKFVKWIGIRHVSYLSLSTWYLNINRCCKAIKIDRNITCIGLKSCIFWCNPLKGCISRNRILSYLLRGSKLISRIQG